MVSKSTRLTRQILKSNEDMQLPTLTNETSPQSLTAPKAGAGRSCYGEQRKLSSRAKGFTLIEVLVVMAIIATLLGLGVGAIKSMASSKGVSTAVPLAESVFKHAREVAKATSKKTLVVVYADDSGTNEETRDRYLRMIGVAQTNDVGDTRLIGRPVTLPSNTYYNANLSNKNVVASKCIFPGSTDKKDCYTYGFNSEGNMATNINQVKQFVVQAGKLRPGEDAPDADSNNSRDIGGFRIFASGSTAIYRSPSQLIADGDDPEF